MIRLLIPLLLLVSYCQAQDYHQTVAKGLDGNDLLSKLIVDYKPTGTLNYSDSRNFLFEELFNVNDTVYGIYTDHGLYLPPGTSSPIQYLLSNNDADGINTEHTYPQSRGAANGNARADLHHLYPARVEVNSSRGSLPFAEIVDSNTDSWYYTNQTQSNIPSSATIDLWSEKDTDTFEPRESVKGDIARSTMYFYTMYKQQADSADPTFFDGMIGTLCEWHFQDPVDQSEWDKTFKIASLAGFDTNPFVLDCSLASRTYCPMISEACQEILLTSTQKIDQKEKQVIIFPNPSRESITLLWDKPLQGDHVLSITDLLGQQKFITILPEGLSQYSLLHKLSSGVYIVHLSNRGYQYSSKIIVAQ